MNEQLSIKSITVGELRRLINEGSYPDDTPIILCSPVNNEEAVGLGFFAFETTLGNDAILLDFNLGETVNYETC